MRLGVLSDVHANLHALDAALADLAARDVDAYLCAGDLVGYGPFPDECVARVLDLPARCVAGNHELILLGELSDARCAAIARDSLRWTRETIAPETRERLAALPGDVRADGVLVVHGAIGDPQRYVETAEQARAALGALEEAAPGARILIAGHTHRPMAVGERSGPLLRGATGEVRLPPGERVLLNPGAVGQSRGRVARAQVMVLDLAAWTASFHAVAYDVEGCRRALRERGLPDDLHHLRPSHWRAVARRARRGARRVRARLATGARSRRG
jgi:predicted phosphodiesterase